VDSSSLIETGCIAGNSNKADRGLFLGQFTDSSRCDVGRTNRRWSFQFCQHGHHPMTWMTFA
jgi:hypothetical protein